MNQKPEGDRKPAEQPSLIASPGIDQDNKPGDHFFLQAPAITLPKGGGAIKSIDEKFSVNAVNGTGSLSIPLPVAVTREGASPSLSLSYNSGSGNSEFGLGWSIQVPSISRKTDKGLPLYWDGMESDTYLITGAEDLVPQLQQNGDAWEQLPVHRTLNGVQYTIFSYRPRTEGSFARIERWVNTITAETHWRTTSRENILSVYGIDAANRIADPLDAQKVFKWLLSYSCDDKGNVKVYEYKNEDFAGIENRLFEKNKTGRCTNTYLNRLLYGNKTPFYRGDALPTVSDFMFRLVFDYGEFDAAGLGFYTNINRDIPADIHLTKNIWAYRKDSFSNCRAGFEIRTYRRCRRVMLFHCFEELRAAAVPYLVQSLELLYNEQLTLEQTTDSIGGFSYLARIIPKTHKLNAGATGYDSRALPAFDFTYRQLAWNTTIQEVTAANIEHVPSPADGNSYQWTDLYSEGISGILMEQGRDWYYKYNLGNGEFSAPKLVAPKPSFSGLSTGVLSIRELSGNGKKYAVGYSGAQQGFFGLSENDSWEPFKPFNELPNIDFKDSNLKWIDLNGDGLPDLLLSEEDIFLWYPAKGELGFDAPSYALKAKDEERGPAIVFADALQSIYLADMTGDGLTDIVRIRNGEVCYWENMGYGRFGAKVSMENTPVFDHPDNFNPAYLRLADIDGSGTTDIVYLGRNDFRVWNNLNGNAWREGPVIIDPFPDIHNSMEISVFDLLGTGTACIVWSSPLPNDRSLPLRYIDITDGKKPHLLIGYNNNLGKQVSLQYLSSTHFYLEDKKTGTPWLTKLPFPVQVVSRTEILDEISKASFVCSYSYHHGYYDRGEREFRGFGRVDQTDTETYTKFVRENAGNITDETLHQPPVLTRTWFHTGALITKDNILKLFGHEYFQNAIFTEYHLPDAHIELPIGMKPEDLPSGDYAEAFRACKGTMLRKEVYGLDGSGLEPYPYAATEENCYIRMLQPRGKNKYAVFLPSTSESIAYNYERVPADPQVKHTCNLEIDEYNNIIKAAAIAYPRMVDNPGLSESLQEEILQLPDIVKTSQAAIHVVLTGNTFTNDVANDTDYRLRVLAEIQTSELTGATPAATYFAAAELKQFADTAIGIAYTDIPDNTKVQVRLLSQERILFAEDDAITPLPLKQQASKGIKYESYKLAYTNQLLATIYTDTVDAALLNSGQYRQSAFLQPLFPNTDATDDWWMPSGTSGYPANPAIHFFLPDKYINPYGKATLAARDTKYHIYIPLLQDAVGNQTTVLTQDFRVLQPISIKDANDNISEVRFDITGLVTGTVQRGKGTEADDFDGFTEDLDETAINNFFNDPEGQGAALLQHATGRVVYDLYHLPVSAASILRERHYRNVHENGGPDKLQYSVEYSGGMAQVLLKKIQATPGIARFIDDTGQLQSIDTSPNPRWIGNGRTVLNNKGKPVKQYQPYFSTNHRYEDDSRLVEVGPTNIIFYDPTGRTIRTELPNETFSTTLFTAWKQTNFDNNDNVTGSLWYIKRFNRQIDTTLIADGKDPALEQDAAAKAARHNDTPLVTHLDTLTRAVCKVAHNKDQLAQDVFSEISFDLDIQGNIRSVINELGHTVIRYQYDIANNVVSQLSPESGRRITFPDIMNHPLRQWDSRNHIFIFTYDDLLRPLTTKVTGGDGDAPLDHVVGKTVYGEGQPNDKDHNLRTQSFEIYDQSGIVTHVDFDFNGNPLTLNRQFCADYTITINWDGIVNLEEDVFVSSMEYDALKRIITVTAPHLAGNPSSAYFPAYNESGLLGSMQVSVPGTAKFAYVTQVNYNEKGLRTDIQYGNNTKTFYTYDKETFRLLHLRTTRLPGGNGFAGGLFKDATVLEDLSHTYDPMGNITSIKDDALLTLFYDGEQVNPLNNYEYDALYQLVNATGRKQAGQTDIQHTRADFNYRNHPFVNSNTIDPNDISAFRNYKEIYDYDKAGNMQQQQHVSKNSSWTRNFEYGNGNNQLTKTTAGAFSFDYTYDVNGNCEAMEHLQSMQWDFSDALHQIDLGGGGEAFYNYDAEGKRTRKVIVKPDGSIRERYYIGSMEIYRERSSTGQVTLERETLQVMDDRQRIAMADTETTQGVALVTLVRYQYSNHLSSAAMEMDDAAKLISYEEFFPFGTTSFSTIDGSREIPAKRYRYTGKERDEESGLNYHGARYYAPWLCRWTAADKMKKKEIDNRYVYVKNNPMVYYDDNGAFEEPTHGAATYHLALAAGFTVDEARQIALATAGMDHDPNTEPGYNERTKDDHFPTFEPALRNVETEINRLPTPEGVARGERVNLAAFGRRLHSLEDAGFVDAPGPHRRGGREPALDKTLANTGLAIGATGLAFVGVGIAGVLSQGTGNHIAGIVSIVLGGLLALVGIAALIASTLHVSKGIGHPIYITEIGNQSDSFRHVADEAYQDPVANRRELRRIYDVLKVAARRLHGDSVRTNDLIAEAVIGVEGGQLGVVNANTAEEIQDFLDMPGMDNYGHGAPAYSDIVRGNCQSRVTGITIGWTDVDIDITVNDSAVHYRSRVRLTTCQQ